MPKKPIKEKNNKDALGPDSLHCPVVSYKPPIPDVNISNLGTNRLKDKVTTLVQMQIKNNQINQNYLNPEKNSAFIQNINYDMDKRDNVLRNVSIYLSTKYDIVSEIAQGKNFKIVGEHDDWNILWVDGAINSTKAFSLKRHQRVNHFPGMNEISRKDKLQKNLKIMHRYFPMDYDIFPKTWSLPAERIEIMNYLRERSDQQRETFIIKPACSSQGRGIILISDVKALSIVGNTICQMYINNPFLIDGYKFDLRIYVLITSCDPFRIYVYEEGLARFATCPYEKPNNHNLNNVYMHLTNYSVQRNSDNYDSNEISGTKRRASTIYDWFKANGYDAEAIWKSIDDVIIKTMLCANNSIQHNYSATFPDQYRTSACFELLGFDIILDDTLKPFVLEVNHSPSLETETPLDHTIKSQLLNDTFNLINSVPSNIRKVTELERMRTAERLYWSRNKYMSSRKAAFEFRKVLSEVQTELERCEMDNRNGYRILYPIFGQTEKYQRFFDFNCEHHRNFFNRCFLLDESEHRKFLELQKETLPKVMTRSINTLDLSKLYRNRLANGDILRSSRSNTILKDPHISKALTLQMNFIRSKEVTGRIPNSNLLDHSKRSLQKILLTKTNELSQQDNYKMSNDFICDTVNKRNTLSMTTNNVRSLSRVEESEAGSCRSNNKKKSRNTKKLKHAVINRIGDTSQYEQTSISSEWESSLCSNKLQHLSNIVIPDQEISLDLDPSTKKKSVSKYSSPKASNKDNSLQASVFLSTTSETKDSRFPVKHSDESLMSDESEMSNMIDSLDSPMTKEEMVDFLSNKLSSQVNPLTDRDVKPSQCCDSDSSQQNIDIDTNFDLFKYNVKTAVTEVNGNNDKSQPSVSCVLECDLNFTGIYNFRPTVSKSPTEIMYIAEIQEIPSGVIQFNEDEFVQSITGPVTFDKSYLIDINYHYPREIKIYDTFGVKSSLFAKNYQCKMKISEYKGCTSRPIDGKHFKINDKNTELINNAIVEYLYSVSMQDILTYNDQKTVNVNNSLSTDTFSGIEDLEHRMTNISNDISFGNFPLNSTRKLPKLTKKPKAKNVGNSIKSKRRRHAKSVNNQMSFGENLKSRTSKRLQDKLELSLVEITDPNFPDQTYSKLSNRKCPVDYTGNLNVIGDKSLDDIICEVHMSPSFNNGRDDRNLDCVDKLNKNQNSSEFVLLDSESESCMKRLASSALLQKPSQIPSNRSIECDFSINLETTTIIPDVQYTFVLSSIYTNYEKLDNQSNVWSRNNRLFLRSPTNRHFSPHQTPTLYNLKTRSLTCRQTIRHAKLINISSKNSNSSLYILTNKRNSLRSKYNKIIQNKIKLLDSTNSQNKSFKLLEKWSEITNGCNNFPKLCC